MQLETGQVIQRSKPLFDENFERLGELGAAVSVWQNGKPIADLYDGFCDAGREKPWTADTVVLVWSATKGIGSACVLHAGVEDDFTYVSTAGGAFLEWLEGKDLPGVEALSTK